MSATESDYIADGIEHAFRFMDQRASVIAEVINAHRERFGQAVREPSIDAVCLTMVGLAALAKFRFQREVGRTNYAEQFRQLLRNYGTPAFSDRLSIPELIEVRPFGSMTQAAIDVLGRRFPPAGQSANHALDRDPTLEQAADELKSKGISVAEGDLERYAYSGIIYRKYRNPVIHGLNIADGEEPYNMWFDAPGMFYANRIAFDDDRKSAGTRRLLGVTDAYLLDLLRTVAANLKSWCLRERRNIFFE